MKVYDSETDTVLDHVLSKYPNVIVADFTLPAAVNENAEMYCRKQVLFVMGTTGGCFPRLLWKSWQRNFQMLFQDTS